jgi:hypothetical protein
VALRGSGKKNLPQCLHFLLRILRTIGLKPPQDPWCYYDKEKKKTQGRKIREENRKKSLFNIFSERRLQGRKQHFQTARFTTISNCRWE